MFIVEISLLLIYLLNNFNNIKLDTIYILSFIVILLLLLVNIENIFYAKSFFTLLLLIPIFKKNFNQLDRIVIMFYLFAALYSFTFENLLDFSKSLIYFIFLSFLILLKYIKSTVGYIIAISILIIFSFFADVRSIMIALLLSIILFKFSKNIIILFLLGLTLTYSIYLIEVLDFLNIGIGKSELDRSLMNYFVVDKLTNYFLFPAPYLVSQSNILSYANSENIYIHNYFLILICYLGIFFIYFFVKRINFRSLSYKNNQIAIIICIVLIFSPESVISRFLLFFLFQYVANNYYD